MPLDEETLIAQGKDARLFVLLRYPGSICQSREYTSGDKFRVVYAPKGEKRQLLSGWRKSESAAWIGAAKKLGWTEKKAA